MGSKSINNANTDSIFWLDFEEPDCIKLVLPSKYSSQVQKFNGIMLLENISSIAILLCLQLLAIFI